MKYIRTTDGRIINTQDERGSLIGDSIVKINDSLIVVRNNKGDELIPIEDIVKQANTIEELCDEFVAIKGTDWHLANNMTLEEFVEENEDLIKAGYKVYGAIWTDKGLIYLAKMNEKGKLELL